MGAGSKLGGHLWVHGDHDLLLLGHQGVPGLHLLGDPVPERLADHGGADVQDPLSRHLLDVGLVRHV